MSPINNHHFRLISVLLFGLFLTGSTSAHYITHLHTEVESAMSIVCADDDYSGHTFHFHDDSAPHTDCDETHCRQASCIAPGIIGGSTTLHEPAAEPVGQSAWATYREIIRLQPRLTGSFLQPHRLVTVLRI